MLPYVFADARGSRGLISAFHSPLSFEGGTLDSICSMLLYHRTCISTVHCTCSCYISRVYINQCFLLHRMLHMPIYFHGLACQTWCLSCVLVRLTLNDAPTPRYRRYPRVAPSIPALPSSDVTAQCISPYLLHTWTRPLTAHSHFIQHGWPPGPYQRYNRLVRRGVGGGQARRGRMG